MAAEGIPEDVLEFLQNFIDSVEQLDVLLLLFAHPTKSWSAADIASELRGTEASVIQRLGGLYSRKVMIQPPELGGLHRFNPSTPLLQKIIRDLAEQNRIRPYRVIDAIFSRSTKAFADAFKFRGDK